MKTCIKSYSSCNMFSCLVGYIIDRLFKTICTGGIDETLYNIIIKKSRLKTKTFKTYRTMSLQVYL